jgi:hypothetical protein
LWPTCVWSGRWSVDKTSNEKERRFKKPSLDRIDMHRLEKNFSLPGKTTGMMILGDNLALEKKAHHLL